MSLAVSDGVGVGDGFDCGLRGGGRDGLGPNGDVVLQAVDVKGAVEVIGGPFLLVRAGFRALFAVAGVGGQAGAVVVNVDGLERGARGAGIGVDGDLVAGGPGLGGGAGFGANCRVVVFEVGVYVEVEVALGGDAVGDVGAVCGFGGRGRCVDARGDDIWDAVW